ncbi:MAG: endo-1,4-beta-xylanase [Phocaeicola sp.]
MINFRKAAFSFSLILFSLFVAAQNEEGQRKDIGSLKKSLSENFLVGVAVNASQVAGNDARAMRLVRRHFNSIVAEDCMKSENIHPEEDRYDFQEADRFVEFGEKNNMFIVGHALIWHSQLAKWFCVDDENNLVSPEILKKRMRHHIETLVKRYKGRIHGWDVVNEAIEENGDFRQSPFYQILGEEYIALAFQYAHEADPDVELYYNDYNMYNSNRRERVVQVVKNLQQRGIRIDAVGMQAHWGISYPNINDVEESIKAFAETGVKVMITEFDLTVLPIVNIGANISDREEYEESLNPYPTELPPAIEAKWNERIEAFFNLFIKHKKVISRVTIWGVTDGDSWKNNWPIERRTDYPLLFNRMYQPKVATQKLINRKE